MKRTVWCGKVSHPDFRGPKPGREIIIKCVLGSSLTHMMTHGIETNVTSLIYILEFCTKIVK